MRSDPVFHGAWNDADFDLSQEFYMGVRCLPVPDSGI